MNVGVIPVPSPELDVVNELARFGCAGARRRSNGNSAHEPSNRAKRTRRTTEGNRVLIFGSIFELALYRAEVLRDRGFAVIVPRDKKEAVAAIRHGDFDIAVLTYTLSNETVQELVSLVRDYCPDCPLIAISDTGQFDRRINPDETVIADNGPAALIAALRKVSKKN